MKGIKKINRGLILTVVVLLAVITYLVIISIKIKPDISTYLTGIIGFFIY